MGFPLSEFKQTSNYLWMQFWPLQITVDLQPNWFLGIGGKSNLLKSGIAYIGLTASPQSSFVQRKMLLQCLIHVRS